MGGTRRGSKLRHQRPELCPLQDLRHQGSEPQYQLACARGGRWPQLSEHVMMCYPGSLSAISPLAVARSSVHNVQLTTDAVRPEPEGSTESPTPELVGGFLSVLFGAFRVV